MTLFCCRVEASNDAIDEEVEDPKKIEELLFAEAEKGDEVEVVMASWMGLNPLLDASVDISPDENPNPRPLI